MPFTCDICNYFGSSKYDLAKHNKTKKHFNNIFTTENISINNETEKKYVCPVCDQKLKHNSSYIRHKKKCYLLDDNGKQKLLEELLTVKSELNLLKKDNEIEKLKYKVKVKDLKLLQIEHPTNQTINITNNIDNSNNNTTTNVKISKLEMLNNNFGNVIDMKTFTENFATPQFGLSERDAENLLEICNNNGNVDAIINSVLYYVNNSMKKQYENKYNIILPKDKVVLPFISGDLSLRYHFEKTHDNEWCKTTSKNNINKLVTLAEKQVFDHKKESIGLNSYTKRRIVNGVLKESLLDNLDESNDYYKSKNNNDNNNDNSNDINIDNSNKIKN
jgi:hypothetical protein